MAYTSPYAHPSYGVVNAPKLDLTWRMLNDKVRNIGKSFSQNLERVTTFCTYNACRCGARQ